MAETSHQRIVRYLQDAIASEHSLESNLKTYAKAAAEDDPAYGFFNDTAKQVRGRFEQMVRRLHSLGAEPSVLSGFFAEISSGGPHTIRKTHDIREATLKNLTLAYAQLQAEQVMLLAVGSAAAVIGDDTTAALTAMLQGEAKQNASACFDAIEPAARTSIGTMPFAAES